MKDVILFIGMWLGIAIIGLLINHFDKSNKNINV
jgi:hypothetical protein